MRILIADDDCTTRLMLRMLLSQLGHEVCEASSGQEAWDQLTGLDPAPLAILDWVMPGISGPELCQRVRQLDAKPTPYIILLTVKRDPKDIVAGLDAGADDFVVKPYHRGELRARVGVGVRVVELQQELWRANHQLEERVTQRTQEVERLLRRREEMLLELGHDLRTPLTPLLALLPLLQETEADLERREMLQLALDGARSLHNRATRVLEWCRVGYLAPVLDPAGVELRGLISGAIAQCRYTHFLERRVLRNDIPDGWRARVDAQQLGEALAHLLDNAVKYTARDGQIVMTARSAPGAVTVAIADNGIGLEAVHLPRVFDPFYKADPSRHYHAAPGLGLSIAKAIIERNGGRVWVESTGLNQGATFYLTLPAHS